MKNLKLIKALLLFFSIIVLNSCDDAVERIDPALIENIDNQNPNCLSPTNVTGAFTTSTNVTLNWTAADDETTWQIQYGISGFALGTGSLANATSSSTVIPGLISTNSYDFWIRTVCSTEEFGDWTGPFTVSPPNPNCATPTGLTVTRNTGNTTATVNWNAGGTETSWEVLYVAAGFPIAQGITLQATSKPYTVTGLTTDSYDFYVRAKCSATETSNWSTKVNLIAVSSGATGIVGNYLMTAFSSSQPTDINADGNSSTNILSETTCFNDLHLELLANNTFSVESKGADIDIQIINNVEVETIACYVDPNEVGTWALNGSILTLTYPDNTTETFTYNSSNNTLSSTVADGTIVGTTNQGNPITLTTDLTIVFTKQ